MNQTLKVTKTFLLEAHRLIILELDKPSIDKSYIQQLNSHKSALEGIDEPYRSLSLKLLQEFTDFANVLNAGGMDLAGKYGQKAMDTYDEVIRRVSRYGV